MYIGTYYYKIDSKNRFSLPSQLRNDFGGVGYITRGFEKCLFLFDEKTFQKEAEKIAGLDYTKQVNREYIRLFAHEAERSEVDAQGRILLPLRHKESVGIGRQVVIVGSIDRIEIWQPERYKEYNEGREHSYEELAERISFTE